MKNSVCGDDENIQYENDNTPNTSRADETIFATPDATDKKATSILIKNCNAKCNTR